MMSTRDEAIDAARSAERQLWQEYGLTVVEKLVDIDSPPLRIRMIECGDVSGDSLVFVNGGLGEAFGWAGLMAGLTDIRCVSLDRPGGGLSDGVDFLEVDVRALATDALKAVLDAAGVRQAAFVANSMGAWWTFQLALRAPERVSRMVMLGSPAVLLNATAPFPLRLMSVPFIGSGLVGFMVPASPAKARETPSFLGHPAEVGQRWSEAEADTNYRFGHLPDFRRSWLTQVRRFLRLWGSNPEMRISEDELHRVEQPTLFLWGKEDPFASADTGRAAAALMPDARLEVVGIGHLPWWDEPDLCARLTREFVQSHEHA